MKITKLDSEGTKGVSISKCGFFISKTHDFKCKQDGIIFDEEESTRGVVKLKFIQVKPGETLTHVLLRRHIIQVKKVLFSDLSANVCHRISLGVFNA